MTHVAFHFNAPDKTAHVCRLLRKAVNKGARVLVLTAAPEALDELLWTFSQVDFLPHSKSGDPVSLTARSPVHLAATPDEVFKAEVLVNLTDGVPSGYGRFDRVIEIVTQDEADRAGARKRWRHYMADGIEPERHDLQAQPAP